MRHFFVVVGFLVICLITACNQKVQNKINIVEVSEPNPIEGSTLTLIADGNLSETNFDIRLRDRLPLKKISLSLLTHGETSQNQTSVTVYVPRGVYATCHPKDRLDDGCMTTFQIFSPSKSSPKLKLNVLKDPNNPAECLAGAQNCGVGKFCDDGLCYHCPADRLLCDDVLPDVIDLDDPIVIQDPETPHDENPITDDEDEEVPDINPLDPDCVENNQCNEGQICQNGFCVDENLNQNQCNQELCPDGFSCDPTLNTCIADEIENPAVDPNQDPNNDPVNDDENGGRLPIGVDLPTIPSRNPCLNGECQVIWPICEETFEGIINVDQDCETGLLDEEGQCYHPNSLIVNIINQIENGLHPCEGDDCTNNQVCKRFPKFGQSCQLGQDCLGNDIPVCYFHNEDYQQGQCLPKDFYEIIRARLSSNQ